MIDSGFSGSSKAMALSPQQIGYRNKIRAKGRGHYIFYRGILGWGASIFLITTLWEWHDKYGGNVPHQRQEFLVHIAVRLVLWLAAGYLFGAIMWKQIFSKPSSDH
jgi:hypothetical protein